ncbi:hypothetical protein [Tenacibaculum aiptasiae]|uniref:hypothetical protein n=1 Tax=Tenacibaculum aiptasiae TaxID=426481 RepID=UPI00232DFAE8|nr:hypothetical protein [Tenacibaculum aiptasiae]
MGLKTKVINVTLDGSSGYGEAILKIDSGIVEKCALFALNTPEGIVNVKIEDANNNEELHPFVTYKEFQPTNGNHYDSRKDIHFDGNRTVKVVAQSAKPLREDFVFQMMFYLNQ